MWAVGSIITNLMFYGQRESTNDERISDLETKYFRINEEVENLREVLGCPRLYDWFSGIVDYEYFRVRDEETVRKNLEWEMATRGYRKKMMWGT